MRRLTALFAAVMSVGLVVLTLPAVSSVAGATTYVPKGVVPGTWQHVLTPSTPTGTSAEYLGTSCVGPMFCVTVGDDYGGVVNDVPIGATWDGSSWHAITNLANGGGGNSGLRAVSCLSSSWCLAVGWQLNSDSNYAGLAELFNGTTWSVVTTPDESPLFDEAFQSVSCTSRTFCEATGYDDTSGSTASPLLMGWNGSVLTAQSVTLAVPMPYTYMHGVSCIAKWCTAVGSSGTGGPDFVAAALTFDNGTWSQSTIPAGTNGAYLEKVSCPSTTMCMAVGQQNYKEAVETNLIEQWNGKTNTWSVDPLTASTAYGDFLGNVDCLGPTSCVAVGYVYTDSAETTWSNEIAAWNGTTWTLQTPPLQLIARPHIATAGYALEAVSCITNDICMSVGYTDNGSGATNVQAISATIYRSGYSEVAADGGFFNFGGAPFYGSIGGHALNAPVVGMAMTPDGGGYWEVATDGGIFAYGDAGYYGSMGGKPLNKPIVGMVPTLDGRGYWLIASDGGIFGFGDATYYGSMGGKPLNKPIVGIALAPSGLGYYEVASDGGLFAFGLPGQAPFLGSTGNIALKDPIVGMAVSAKGGYYEVASDGGLFAFGGTAKAPFLGSMGGKPLVKPIVGMAVDPAGGYYEVASDGGLFNFGAPYHGSMGGKPLVEPIVGIAT